MEPFGRKLIVIVASGAGIGFSPYCPGTLGTLVAVPVSLMINRLAQTAPVIALAVLAALILSAIALAGEAARALQLKDPQVVVIDEIAGFAVANFLSYGVDGLVAAFVLFRFFDIGKVFPIARLEALPGGAGIVLDDVMAGIYTFMIVRLLLWIGLL